MRLVRWRPNMGMPTIHDEMERVFDNFFGLDRKRTELERFDWTPRVNVVEHEDRFEITAEIPGMNKEDVQIELHDNLMTIKGEKQYEKEEKESNYHICERSYGTFQRSFALPQNVKDDNIEAEYNNGVLTVNLPKKEPAKPKEIKVKIK
jgi:HSP20 family protein